jgi:hypothetical protein
MLTIKVHLLWPSETIKRHIKFGNSFKMLMNYLQIYSFILSLRKVVSIYRQEKMIMLLIVFIIVEMF